MKVYDLYMRLLNRNNILIAGSAGSGKSTLINALIYTTCAMERTPIIYLIDPKRIDLKKFRNMKNVAKRVTEPEDAIALLQSVINLMEERYAKMDKSDDDFLDKSEETPVYIIIDEVADLILTHGKTVTPLIQRIAAKGRASNIHLIVATQTLSVEILKTAITNNFDAKIALRTATANQSRVIIGENGAERLPEHGHGIVMLPQTIKMYELPAIDPDELKRVIQSFNR